MLRTRLVWFGLGFATSGVAVSQLVYRDLLVDRHAFVAEMNGKFDELEARVRNIEAVPSSHGSPAEIQLRKRAVIDERASLLPRATWPGFYVFAAEGH